MYKKGFTLIEMLVAVALFTTVMVIALGALLAMSQSDRKAETLKSVIDNLNFSLDSMSRAIRTGVNYHCGTDGTPGVAQSCIGSSGAQYLSFTASDGTYDEYQFSNDPVICGNQVGCIMRQITPPGTTQSSGWQTITAPDVRVTSLIFYVVGAEAKSSGDTLQPKVTLLLHGYIPVNGNAATQSVCNTNGNTCSLFNLQTSVVQRVYDQ